MFSCGLSALFFLVLGVFVYRAWDWHNDIFRLTPTQILDIEKKPLGAESKKTANLDAPDLRIEHIRPSFLANVLNFGIVTVYIGQTPFNLEGVYDPDQVHQEIASKREALVYKKRQDEESRERDRMLQYLVALYVESEKLKNSEEP
jgi:hypothetical protein